MTAKPVKKPTAAQARVAHAAHLAHVAHLAHLAHIGKAAPGAQSKPAVKPKAAAAKKTVKKKAAAPYPDTWTRSGVRLGEVSLHELPACGPVALAEHLAVWTGICLPAGDVLALHDRAGVTSLDGLLERVQAEGLAGPGTKLAHYEPCDPDTPVPGLIYGIRLDAGYHAVLSHGAGMISWGELMPRCGTPEEAWWLEWEAG